MSLTIYNQQKYGQQLYYGSASPDAALLWTFQVAWDGSYSGINEASRMIDFNVSRGRDFMLAPNGGFEPFQQASATIVLDNSDLRYDPRNTSSPLYPNILPGKLARLKVKDTSTGDNFAVFFGIISDIKPYNKGLTKIVHIELTDALGWLKGRNVRTFSYTGIQYDNLSTLIAKTIQSDYPSSEWPVNSYTSNTLPRFWLWNEEMLKAQNDLALAEFGNFFHSRTGSLNFTPSGYTWVSTTDIDEDELLVDISLPQPWENIRNTASVYCYPVERETTITTCWGIGEEIVIAAGQTINLDAIFRYQNFNNVALTGFSFIVTFTSSTGGGGSSLSYSLTTDTPYSAGVPLIFTNTSASTGYLSRLDIQGQPYYVPYKKVARAQDATSVGKYGIRDITIDTPWIQEFDYAQDYANYLVSALSNPLDFPTILIEHRPQIQFGLDLYRYRVHLTSSVYNIDGYFRVGKIEHRPTNATCQSIITKMKLEPVLPSF